MESKPLKVLVSAYACEPGRGSEPGVGWNIVRRLSAKCRLTVVTRANNQPVIENSGEPWIRNVRWVYYDPPKWLTFWKRGGRGVQLFYVLWQLGVFNVARKLHGECRFDVVHHLTFGKYWVPSLLALLDGKFVFGPVGGGERLPPGFLWKLGWRGVVSELCKGTVVLFFRWVPGIGALYRKAAWTLAATDLTAERLRRMGVERISVLHQSGIDADEMREFRRRRPSADRWRGARFVTAARLVHWKGIELAIRAIAEMPEGAKTRLDVLQDGPELGRLRKLSVKLGVEDRVRFRGRLDTLEDVFRAIAEADALVHPALHEAFGQVCVEALSIGTPVICLKWGGPGMIVDETCGRAVAPDSYDGAVEGIASAMLEIERGEWVPDSGRCIERAKNKFSWDRLVGDIFEVYRSQ